ncbi:hypothetical protein [Lactobacillus sp. ESL0225]|uniref:hypothetical protein n=1 Tax=Lactobacillus sp. ESL0225 TaxID=2069351 RepID=UPI000EFC482D|nr:hypothetical protein [Lactobacillus sp. ESL0225]RMC50813.1 hypothetical protein F5ESL0225_04265 [Lactobacillus sp. ESL0225]
MTKLTEAKKRANEKWNKKNKERINYLNHRSQSRSFIRRFATKEDLDELEKLIAEKRKKM